MKTINVVMFLIFCLVLGVIWVLNVSGSRSEKLGKHASDSQRMFYLTLETHLPTEAETACTEGYHFADLAELRSFSSLNYNTDLGLSLGDSGLGPPSLRRGWVRDGSEYYPGGNCSGWTDSSASSVGSVAFVEGPQEWGKITGFCDLPARVWCVSDSASRM